MLTFIDLILLFMIFYGFALYFTDRRIFVHTKPVVTKEAADAFVTLHFIHGFFPKRKDVFNSDFPDFFKKNKVGGYAALEIDSHIYVFEVRHGSMHLIPYEHHKEFNSIFKDKTPVLFALETAEERVTSIEIPVTEDQKKSLVEICTKYASKTPYDYALFGMGSAASIYEILAKGGVVTAQDSINRYMFYAFNTRMFRKRILDWATRNDFDIIVREGSKNKNWEK